MFAVKGTGEGCSCEIHAVCISETERRCVEDLKSRAEFVGTPLYPVLIWNLDVNLDSRDTSFLEFIYGGHNMGVSSST